MTERERMIHQLRNHTYHQYRQKASGSSKISSETDIKKAYLMLRISICCIVFIAFVLGQMLMKDDIAVFKNTAGYIEHHIEIGELPQKLSEFVASQWNAIFSR